MLERPPLGGENREPLDRPRVHLLRGLARGLDETDLAGGGVFGEYLLFTKFHPCLKRGTKVRPIQSACATIAPCSEHGREEAQP